MPIETLIVIIGLMFATVMVVSLGDRTNLPWPVLLTLLTGITLFVPGIPHVEVPPELILPLFLPPLLWALAQAKLGMDPDTIARTAMEAGYDVSPIRALIDMLSQR